MTLIVKILFYQKEIIFFKIHLFHLQVIINVTIILIIVTNLSKSFEQRYDIDYSNLIVGANKESKNEITKRFP